MITQRRAKDRGFFDHGWLQSYHTFSFARYIDRKHMGFRSLRVINEDFISGDQGFGMHEHQDMEILTYIIAGELQHQDSVGNKKRIVRGEVQRMTAGSGIRHSEVNTQKSELTHLLQIWVLPAELNLAPSYEQKNFDPALQTGEWVLLVHPEGLNGALRIHQDCKVYGARPSQGASLRYDLGPGRGSWLQVISGEVQLESFALSAGDACSIESIPNFQISALSSGCEFLLFDLGGG